MKLTKIGRQAFVTAAMDDVPQIDYQDKLSGLLTRKEIALRKAAGISDKVDVRRLESIYLYVAEQTYYLKGLTSEELLEIKQSPAVKKLVIDYDAQKTANEQLKLKLLGVAAACNTRKQLLEALPEFEKYMPQAVIPGSNLPALANVLSDFVKAGWPKQQKRITKAVKEAALA